MVAKVTHKKIKEGENLELNPTEFSRLFSDISHSIKPLQDACRVYLPRRNNLSGISVHAPNKIRFPIEF